MLLVAYRGVVDGAIKNTKGVIQGVAWLREGLIEDFSQFFLYLE